MRSIELSDKVKYLNRKENLIFLISSLLIVWIWTFVSINIDRENDRGMITLIGFSLIFPSVISVFFSKNKVFDFFISLFLLLLLGFLTFIISLIPNFYLIYITGLDWVGFIIPTILTGLSFYFIIRCVFSFPDNKKAFIYILTIPIIIIVSLCCLPFYDGIFAHETGIGFLIGIYLSLLFGVISFLCSKKKTTHNTV